jgi:hypothetical protein
MERKLITLAGLCAAAVVLAVTAGAARAAQTVAAMLGPPAAS